ncbi:hypothetical protein [Sphingomonas sp.]|uniref:hypothetical protein n=1 Tax=Sphingomonas sp. TaxID=28214 RepID=UPI003B3B4800
MLVVGKAANDGVAAQIWQPQPVAQQRQHHFGIKEAAAVQQREHEIHVGRLKQRLVAVGDRQIEPDRAQHVADFGMVGGVGPVRAVGHPLRQSMLGDIEDAKALLGLVRDRKRPGLDEATGHPVGLTIPCVGFGAAQ